MKIFSTNNKGLKSAIIALMIILVMSGCSLINKNSSSVTSEETTVSAESSEENPDVFAKGTKFGTLDISGMTLTEAITAGEKYINDELASISVTVKIKDDSMVIKGSDVIHTDVAEEVLTQAFNGTRNGELPAKYTVDLSNIQDAIQSAGDKYKVDAKNATVTGYDASSNTFSFSDATKGVAINLEDTLKAIKDQFEQGKSGTVEAVFTETDPVVNSGDLTGQYVKLSTFSTYSTNTANGTHNMALALEHVNGTVVQPGEVFSFNDTVGDSTSADTGFLPAGGIISGVISQVYGGGICQASTTIYVAAMECGMDVVMRECHSMPSTYVDIGLDATVSYGELDFQFRNPLKYPVYIESYVDGNTLTVNFYGVQPAEWDKIEVSSWCTGTIPIPDGVRFIVDGSLQKDEVELKTNGYQGYTAEAQRTYYKNGEAVKVESLPSSEYGTCQKTYMVGPGTNTDNIDSNGQIVSSTQTDEEPEETVSSEEPAATPEPTPETTPESEQESSVESTETTSQEPQG